MDELKKYDRISSVSSEFSTRTPLGGVFTLCSIVTVACLLFPAFRSHYSPRTQTFFTIQSTLHPTLPLQFDITFPNLPCSKVHVAAEDLGAQEQSLHLDKAHHIYKRRLNDKGFPIGGRKKHRMGGTVTKISDVKSNRDPALDGPEREGRNATEGEDEDNNESCGDCYGAGDEGECCDTCDDVRRAYRRKGWTIRNNNDVVQCRKEGSRAAEELEGEGCNVYGDVVLQGAGGNLHFAGGPNLFPPDSGMYVPGMIEEATKAWNVSHVINSLTWGPSVSENQLDGQKRMVADGRGQYQYFFTLVPTVVSKLGEVRKEGYQYSVTEHLRHLPPNSALGLPGVYLHYDVSPVKVEEVERRETWGMFVTTVAAVFGGSVAFWRMIDRAAFSRIGGDRLG